MKKKLIIFALVLITSIFTLDICLNKAYAECTSDYCNYEKAKTVTCGGTTLPSIVPSIVSTIYTIILITIPIVLVILGSIDLVKGLTGGKEDEIKKGQQMFVKRLISAVLVFFVFVAVKFVIGIVSKNSETIMKCANCIINNDCVTKEAGEDGKWTCSLLYEGTQYDIIYDGVGVSKATFVKNSTINYIIDSAFVPTKVNECPSRDEYALIREEDDIEITWKIVSK